MTLLHWWQFVLDDEPSTDDPRLVTCPHCVEVLLDVGGRALFACGDNPAARRGAQ